MSLTPSVAIDSTNPFSVHWVITASGLSSITGATSVTVNRTHTHSSDVYVVRGLDMAPVSGDSVASEDYDISLIRGGWSWDFYVYDSGGSVLASSLGVGSETPTEIITPCMSSGLASPWTSAVLQSIQQPALNIPVVLGNWDQYDKNAAILGNYKILGRKNPVVIGDAFGARTGTFTILVDAVNLADSTMMGTQDLQTHQQLLEYNDVLFLQLFWEGLGFDDLFFRVTDYQVQRLSPAQPFNFADSDFPLPPNLVLSNTYQITVTFQEVDRPATAGEVVAFGTWADVDAHFDTWGDVDSNRTNWLDVLNRANLA